MNPMNLMNTIQLAFAQPWAERLGWTLLNFVWQGALIGVLFAALRGLAGHRLSVNGRYVFACLALLAMVAAPLVTFGVMAVLEPASIARMASAPPPSNGVGGIPIALAQSGAWQRVLPWLVMTWIGGVMVFSVRLIGGWFGTARLRRVKSRPAPADWQQTVDRLTGRMGIAQSVRLTISSLVEAPAVIGWLRPMILIPVGALTGLPAEHLEALLTHELAHVLRRDYLVNVLQSVAEAVLFYHPAVWWISAQIRHERELCCDDLAVAASGDVLTYARALAELESCRPAHLKAAMAANGGGLLHRIARLLGQPQPASHTRPGPAAAWVLSILLLAGIGAVVVRGAQDQTAAPAASAQELTVSRDAIWMDTVKLGDMNVEVRALGLLTTPDTAELKVAESQVKKVKLGQAVTMDARGGRGTFAGVVTRIRPGASNGTVTVDVQIPGPHKAQVGDPVDGIIEIERLTNVVYVGRPVMGQADSDGTLYKLEPDGKQAVRVKVQFGKSSVNAIVIRSGLQPGDKIILSDVTAFLSLDRINLK
ncbi:MAG TPA: M56 family metallopeptidase [Candidatus Acidoferrales bacterium]|nr:M56 family metallopeptidase [Candidatus Acidoferrales bacterium]